MEPTCPVARFWAVPFTKELPKIWRVMDVLSMLEESDDEGVIVMYEPVLPPVNSNVDGNLAPPPPAPDGISTPVDNEIEDVEDEHPLSECLTRKMSGQGNKAGGSGTTKAGEKSNFMFASPVAFNVTP
ncbi:hypothetical protein Tco_0898306 [Tanacetum coccineum]